MATGLSLSATLGIMAVLAANQPQWSASTVAAGATGTVPGAPNTTVVTDVVPRTVVLQPGQTPPAAGAPGATDAAAAAGGTTVDQGGAAPASDVGGAAPPAPVDTGGGAAPPAPAPAPVVTQPPATQPPTTVAPPPTCSGSKCP
jgi:hypothetical protein